MKTEKIYRSDNVITFPVLEGKALHNLVDDTFYELDSDISEEIWENLDGLLTVEEIVQKLASKYDVEEEQLEMDVKDFIGQLLENGLAEKVIV